MGELPDEFSCTITDWEYIYGLCRDVADDVKAAEFEPDVVVALARGGWFGGRCLCDFLGLDDLASLKVEHYVGTAAKGEEAQVKYPLADGAVEGKDVLVVDDIADTGQSIETAAECVRDRNPSSVRTATLQLLQTSDHEPEFVGESLDEWTWVVYPWNFVEDMVELVAGVMAKSDQQTHTEDDIRRLLREYHGVSRTNLEIAQPNRLGEVTTEMERRGVVESAGDGWQLTDD
ncbi:MULTISPECIES: phosphoribosyltransferase [Haloarcula]|jgi:hypoxanthine phosphoribosyltransferase|uniref:Phosphoribosyltransferase n=3 Tax=Haloarcula marismortui TaxID=2238 RepID=Q5V1E7_HALMA|nr:MULTISPECIES: phosphoribosyltransferase [Haloarcula]AAV46655.1 purine phosphoribosyltransferase [Haloarcula marismortui ATCC 43049]EMA15881.1 purine phosphoribosyltransferase [Haloarcula sinaiiensis ATCC 33800]EMA20612.1 purine phosphoribosyltransferase [Haloarcula californiae ATCC 33799]NHN61711.1 phosphoribosyltransferase [Haloarcula sp. JP-Z28]NHX40629.1 phosphoribosyltransferase [Haloarcula sp. R1-2]